MGRSRERHRAGAEAAAALAGAAVGSTSGPFWPHPVNPAASRATTIDTLMALGIREILSTMVTAPAASPLSDREYHRLTDALLTGIEARVDRWLQDDVIDIDTQRTGGLLELTFPGGSKIVINTQPPLQEVWLAARSGGFHYRHVDGRWLDTRDGSDFLQALSQHASVQAGRPLDFAAGARRD
jgi:CyaY protein